MPTIMTQRHDGSEWSWARTPALVDGRRVLVVGEPAEAAGFIALFRKLGARVLACSDVELALTLLGLRDFDIVVADPHLCVADGRPFATALHEEAPRNAAIPILAPPSRVGLLLRTRTRRSDAA